MGKEKKLKQLCSDFLINKLNKTQFCDGLYEIDEKI